MTTKQLDTNPASTPPGDVRYEGAIHHYGRRLITRDGPAQGLLEWPQHVWGRITPRPLGLINAKLLADAQDTHATVQIWMTDEIVYSNGKQPLVPAGWYSPNAQMAAGNQPAGSAR